MVLLSSSDYSKGFGGKFGVQNDRMDKVRSLTLVCVRAASSASSESLLNQSAGTFEDVEKPAPTYQKTKPVEAGEL